MKKNRKPFKDTELYKVLKKVAPNALDAVQDVGESIFPPLAIVNKVVDRAFEGKLNTSDKAVLGIAKREYEEEYEMQLTDVQDAREMYEVKSDTADQIAKRIMNHNMLIVCVLVIFEIGVIAFVEGQVAAVITGIIGTITGALINERTTVVNFFYGSSKSSKDKDIK